jgi:hypothetical protein
MAFEHAAEHQHAHDVLATAHDAQERVHLRPARAIGARGEDVEAERQAEVDRRFPELVERGGVVVGLAPRQAGHHHAAQAGRFDRLHVGDALFRRTHRGLPDAEQALGRERAVLGDPAVVGLEARVLVVGVAVVAQDHADGGIDDLGGHAVTQLIGEARRGIPAAAVEIGEVIALHADLVRCFAGGGRGADVDGVLEPVDDEHVAVGSGVDHARCAVEERLVDVVDVGAGRLGDVRVGRDDRIVHEGDS